MTRPPRAPHRAALRGLLGLLVGLVALGSACGGSDKPDRPDGPDPKAAAVALASALAAGDLAKGPFTDATATTAQAGYDPIVADLGADQAKVTVASVATGRTKSTAKAVLRWSWDLGEATWSYDDPVTLQLTGGEWRVPWSPALVEPSLKDGEQLTVSSVLADRGDILGRGGLALVTEREVSRVGLDKPSLDGADPSASARALAQLVGVDVKDFVKQVAAAGPQAFVEAIVYRRDEVPAGLPDQVAAIPGGRLISGSLPLAPTKDFAAPILGRVGSVTAEMIEKNPAYHPGDVAGLSGLEARYDADLRGQAGVSVNAVDAAGHTRGLYRTEAKPGTDLATTLDLDLQEEAERILANVGPASALVAIKPSTGEILAAANGPGNGGQNLATYGQFPPGSTFKTVSSLALLRKGLTPDTVVPCPASITVDGKVFTNDSEYPPGATGNIALRSALANSCNTAYISQVGKLSGTDLFDAGVSLGIGLDHDLGFPAYFGHTDPDSTETGAAAQMIGQGTILGSPMVMATVMATIQSGTLVIPRLVDSVQVSAPDGAVPLTADEDSALKSMLRDVVTSGTGRGLADLPGPPVLAKTGTAEFGTAKPLKTHAWMIAAQGDLAVCAFVDVGHTGSGTAGPLLHELLAYAQANGLE